MAINQTLYRNLINNGISDGAARILADDTQFGAGGGGGGTTLLGTYSAAAAGTLDALVRNAAGLSGALFRSDYSAYRIEVLEELLCSQAAGLQFKLHVAAGFSAANYKVAGLAFVAGASALYGQNGLTAGGFSNANDFSATAGEGVVGSLDVFQPASALSVKKIETHTRWITGAVPKNSEGMISWHDATSVDGCQLFFTAGTITGKIAVYGYGPAAA